MGRTRPTSSSWLMALTAAVSLTAAGTGCLAPGSPLTARERAVAAAARPILRMDPDANWTACFNRLVELGPLSVSYLVRQPALLRRAAPDDLRVMLHTSLLRRLAQPGTAPRLSANCLETTLDVLHFDLKVRGRRLGSVRLARGRRPRAWHELYPADFDHALAAQIDVEADRRAIRRWWRRRAGQPGTLVTTRRMRPRAEFLWPLLARRPADRWTYTPQGGAVLCGSGEDGPYMMRLATQDYNLVRAACIWLGSARDPTIEERLIGLVGSPLGTVAHNARLALGYCPDPRIRAVLRRHEDREDLRAPPPGAGSENGGSLRL